MRDNSSKVVCGDNRGDDIDGEAVASLPQTRATYDIWVVLLYYFLFWLTGSPSWYIIPNQYRHCGRNAIRVVPTIHGI